MKNNSDEISIRLPDTLTKRMEKFMGGEYLTKGEFIRMALYHLLEDYGDELKTIIPKKQTDAEKTGVEVLEKEIATKDYDYTENETKTYDETELDDELETLKKLKRELEDI